jgi:cell division septum initiation protein DivIVA
MQAQVESCLWGSRFLFVRERPSSNQAVVLHLMFSELTPNAIRTPTLKRRLRGYDTQETEELFVRVAESYERVRVEREALSERLENLRREQEDHERDSRVELDKLQEELRDRDGRIAELKGQIARIEEEHSKQLEDVERLNEELSSARAAQEAHQAELAEQNESVARLETREKALVEQIAMFAAQLEQGDAAEAAPTSPHALSDLDERAAATLLRLERVAETVARETRRDTEMMLKKARERADEILHSAEVRSRRVVEEIARQRAVDEAPREEFDPVAALERVEDLGTDQKATDEAEQQLGEAGWTSGSRPEQTPERSQ